MSIKDNFPSVGPSLSLNFARSKTLDPRITFSRSSVGTYMDENGLIVTGSADEPRFDHKIENGVVKSLGLLVEEQRTNLLNYSEDFSASPGGWTLSATGASRTQNLIGPDGVTNSAWTITDSDNTGDLPQFYKQISISASSSTKYCISCFMKDVDNAGITPDLYAFFSGNSTKGSYVRYTFSTDSFTAHASDGGGIQPSIYGSISYPNGWVRLYFVVDDSNNGSNTALQFRIYPNGRGSNTTGSMGFFGAQIEEGEFPTSYIPTSGATKTRSPDNVTMTGTNFSDWYNQDEGTVYVSQKLKGVQDDSRNNLVYKINGGGGSDYLYNTKSGDKNIFIFGDGGTNYSRFQDGTDSTDTKTAWAYDVSGDDFKPYYNGIEVTNETTTNTPSTTSHTQLELGASSGAKYCGHIQQFAYYPKRLTNTQLQNLTK